MSVNITDLDLYTLISELWSNARVAGFFMMTNTAAPNLPSRENIDAELGSDKYIDYLNGRAIKTDFSNLSEVSTFLYNRDAGPGKFESIVAQLRSS